MQALKAESVLDEILEPITRCLTADNAQQLVDYRPRRTVLARIDRLARKCNEGELTPEERAEYETYVFAGEFVALLQAKARALLRKPRRLPRSALWSPAVRDIDVSTVVSTKTICRDTLFT
jgi:hypothetical protein